MAVGYIRRQGHQETSARCTGLLEIYLRFPGRRNRHDFNRSGPRCHYRLRRHAACQVDLKTNPMLSYTEARQKVIEVASAIDRPLLPTHVEIEQAFGRILAEPVLADRDYPPFDRSTRDGFAVRSDD